MKRIFLLLIVSMLSYLSVFAQGKWNLVWREDFGVAEDTVIKDFPNASMNVPRHSFAGYDTKEHYGSTGYLEYHEQGEWIGECGTIKDGQYGIANSSWWAYNRRKACDESAGHFVGGRDHTGNKNGAMLIVNSEVGTGLPIYKQTIEFDLCDSREYKFAIYAASITTYQGDGGNANLELKVINSKTNEEIENIKTGDIPFWEFGGWGSENPSDCAFCERNWTEYSCTFTANDGDVLELQIVNWGSGYNDFVLDDISLYRNDDIEVIDPTISTNTISSENTMTAGSCVYNAAFNVPDEVLNNWRKVYDQVYFLWQRSKDDGLTWENVPSVSGLEKTNVEIEVNKDIPEVYRVIITGSSTASLAEEQALYIAEHGGPKDGCSYFSISNTLAGVSPTPDCSYQEDGRLIWMEDFGILDSFSIKGYDGVPLQLYEENKEGFTLGNYVITAFPDTSIRKPQYSWDGKLTGYSFNAKKIRDASGLLNGAFLYTYFGKATGVESDDLLFEKVVSGPFCSCKSFVLSFEFYDTNEWAGEKLLVQVTDDGGDVLGTSSIDITHSNSRQWSRQLTPFNIENGYKGNIHIRIINQTPSNNWNYVSFDNFKIAICGETTPQGKIQIDSHPNVAFYGGFDCNELPAQTVSISDEGEWKKYYPNYGYAWQYSEDGGTTWKYLGTNRINEYDGPDLVQYRAVFAESADEAEVIATTGKPTDPCVVYGFSNVVALQCKLTGCKAPIYKIEGDTVQEVCSDASEEIVIAVKQQNKTNVDGMQWYSKLYNANAWSSIDGATTESLTVSTIPVDSTDYLFIALNDTCYSDSIFFRLNVHTAITLEEMKDTILCKGNGLDLKAVALTGTPSIYKWSNSLETSEELKLSSVEKEMEVTVSATDGICSSEPVSINIEVESPITFTQVDDLRECFGNPISIDPQVQGTVQGTIWKIGEEELPDNKDELTYAGTANTSAVYSVEFIANKCENKTMEVAVTVEKSSDLSLSASAEVVCEGSDVLLTAEYGESTAIEWEKSTDGVLFTNFSDDLLQKKSVTVDRPTYYRIKAAGSGICQVAYSDVIFVNTESQYSPEWSKGSDIVCENTLYTFLIHYESEEDSILFVTKHSSQWLKDDEEISTDFNTSILLKEGCTISHIVSSEYCDPVRTDFEMTVLPAPVLDVAVDKEKVCYGSSIRLSATVENADKVYWVFQANESTTSTTISDGVAFSIDYEPTQSGIYALYAPSNGYCRDTYSDLIMVDVEEPLSFTIQDIQPVVCAGNSIQLSAVKESGDLTSVSWKKNGEILVQDFNAEDIPTEDVSYTFEAVASVCPSFSAQMDVTVEKSSDLYLSIANENVCKGDEAFLIADFGELTSVEWESSKDGLNYSTFSTELLNSYKINPDETSYYRLKSVGSGSCPQVYSDPIKVIVEQPVEMELGVIPTVICQGSSVDLSAMIISGTPKSYSWTKSEGEELSKSLTATDIPVASTTYLFTTVGNYCPDKTLSVKVDVEVVEDLSLSLSDDKICKNTPVTLTATYGESTSLFWEYSTDGITYVEFDNDLVPQKEVLPEATTTYRLKSAGVGACEQVYSSPVTVEVEQPVSFILKDVPSIVCEGTTLDLAVSEMAGDVKMVEWTKNGTPFSETKDTRDVPEDDETIYELKVKGEICPSYAQQVTVQIEKKPTLNLTISDQEVCKGTDVTLVLVAENCKNVLWQKKNGSTADYEQFGEGVKESVTIEANESASYRVVSTQSDICGNVISDPVSLMVEMPVSVSLPSNKLVCPEEETFLSALIGGSPKSIEWYSQMEGESYQLMSQSEAVINVAPLSTTNYKIVAVASYCPDAEAIITVNVDEVPQLDLEVTSDHLCEGDALTLSTSFGYVSNIVWSVKEEGTASFRDLDRSKGSVTIYPTTTAEYKISAMTQANCPAGELLKMVVVDKAIKMILEDKMICEGDKTTLIPEGGLSSYTYEWREKGEEHLVSSEMNLEVQPSVTKSYELKVMNGMCQTDLESVVAVSANPQVISCEEVSNKTYEIVVESENSLKYDFGDGKGETISNRMENVSYGKSYNIIITDEIGCKTSYLLETPVYDIIIPEYFNPNEKTWKVENLDRYANSSVAIYDRFGKLIVEMEGNDMEGWDGTYKGRKMPSTDYWYVVNVGEIDVQYAGHFTLIR